MQICQQYLKWRFTCRLEPSPDVLSKMITIVHIYIYPIGESNSHGKDLFFFIINKSRKKKYGIFFFYYVNRHFKYCHFKYC